MVGGRVVLIIDRATVTAPSVTKVGHTTTVTYNLPSGTTFPSGSAHTLNVSVKDSTGALTSVDRPFKTGVYTLMQPSWKVTADTSKPGFLWNYFANRANTGNTIARAE